MWQPTIKTITKSSYPCNDMSESTEPVEKRADPRFKARIVIFDVLDQRRLISNYSVNMSTGGVFIETDDILPVDTLLLVKFKLPDNDTIIVCKARVAWTNEPGHLKKFSFPLGMSLQFLNLSLDNMYVIRDYLNKGNLVPTWWNQYPAMACQLMNSTPFYNISM
jgi:uncharacterized protein (TIGR02266 family)